jgi:hypothetical protein
MKPLQSLLLMCSLAATSAGATQSADEIMKQVDFTARKSFSTELARVKITTCKYAIQNGNVKCTEKPRVVVAEGAKKLYRADGQYSDKVVSIVSEPISDKGTSLLTYEYGERGRDNDNWFYLPALAKVNRVIANDEEGGSIFGSEFSVDTIENPEARKIYEYTYKLVEEATYDGRATWVVEIIPSEEKAKRTDYDKVVVWVDKEYHIALKEDLYRGGKLHKQRTQSGIKQVDGVFVATKIVMNNRSRSRISQMDRNPVRLNTEIPDEFFSQRALTDFSFKERHLAQFRAELDK